MLEDNIMENFYLIGETTLHLISIWWFVGVGLIGIIGLEMVVVQTIDYDDRKP